MTHIKQLEKLLNVKIDENWPSSPDLSIYTQSTADGYDIYIITNDESRLDWENDVFYYEPSFDEIIERIKEVASDYDDEQAVIYCSDIEQFFDEYAVEDYLVEHDEELQGEHED